MLVRLRSAHCILHGSPHGRPLYLRAPPCLRITHMARYVMQLNAAVQDAEEVAEAFAQTHRKLQALMDAR